MLFQSQIYLLVFLPISVAIYYAIARFAHLRQWVLIGVSLFFYGWWDIRFIPLLVGQVVATWLLATVQAKSKSSAPLVAGIILNLASLATFKYLDFIVASLEAVTGLSLPRTQLVLPIGISFFSFQLISYLVDRMRGEAPLYPLRPFALFVLLFPHLIAGPIVRHNELIPQFALNPLRSGLWMRIGCGLMILTLGLGKKVLLADQLAPVVDLLFRDATMRVLTFGESWTATLSFSLQLFLDFSAYTEMAIGTALIFGLVLPENFRRPYLSADLREFWRRWHISLSNFIRDYLYIPLGGSRHGRLRTVAATLGSMAVCGLWHGAGWTYVVWGVWHGLGLVICRSWQSRHRPLPAAVGWVVTMLFVMVGWVIFRSANFMTAGSVLASMTGLNGWSGALQAPRLLLIAAAVSALVPSAHELKDRWLGASPVLALAAAALAAYCILQVGQGAPLNFIYFQF